MYSRSLKVLFNEVPLYIQGRKILPVIHSADIVVSLEFCLYGCFNIMYIDTVDGDCIN